MGKSFHPVEAIGAAFEGPLLFLLASLPSGQVVSPFDEISATRFAFVPLTSVAAFIFFHPGRYTSRVPLLGPPPPPQRQGRRQDSTEDNLTSAGANPPKGFLKEASK